MQCKNCKVEIEESRLKNDLCPACFSLSEANKVRSTQPLKVESEYEDRPEVMYDKQLSEIFFQLVSNGPYKNTISESTYGHDKAQHFIYWTKLYKPEVYNAYYEKALEMRKLAQSKKPKLDIKANISQAVDKVKEIIEAVPKPIQEKTVKPLVEGTINFTEQQEDTFLDIWWDKNGAIYDRAFAERDGCGLDMIEWLRDLYPKLFNFIYNLMTQ